MNRFSALDETLQANTRFKNINPLYFIIANDANQVESYKNSIKRNGKWDDFQDSHNLHILPIEYLENKENKFLKLLTGHLRALKGK